MSFYIAPREMAARPKGRPMSETRARCPGGYLIGPGAKLCGPTGNNCVGQCAFAYRSEPTSIPGEGAER